MRSYQALILESSLLSFLPVFHQLKVSYLCVCNCFSQINVSFGLYKRLRGLIFLENRTLYYTDYSRAKKIISLFLPWNIFQCTLPEKNKKKTKKKNKKKNKTKKTKTPVVVLLAQRSNHSLGERGPMEKNCSEVLDMIHKHNRPK